MRFRAQIALLALPVSMLAKPAHATYSIVAADQTTRQVGGSVTSCVAPSSVASVYGGAPGFGAIHAQAASNVAGRNEGVRLLRLGTAPMQIIQQITSPQFDSNAAARQYGVVDLQGRAAGFTGMTNGVFADDRQGTVGTFAYSIQGNILTGKAVLDQAETGFRTSGCDLADRLMLALEAGARNGQGDRRCTPAPSDSAFIEVDLEGATAGSYLRLSVVEQVGTNPLPRLRTMFNTWRMTHPCAGAADGGAIVDSGAQRDAVSDVLVRADASDARSPDGSGGAVGTGGSTGSGGTSAGGTTSTGSAGSMGSTTSAGGATGATGTTTGSGTGSGTGGNGGGTTGGSPGTGPGDTDTGCSCRLPGRNGPVSVHALVGFALAIAATRRRRQS